MIFEFYYIKRNFVFYVLKNVINLIFFDVYLTILNLSNKEVVVFDICHHKKI